MRRKLTLYFFFNNLKKKRGENTSFVPLEIDDA